MARDLERAAAVGEVEAAGRIDEAGEAVLRLEAESAEASADLELGRRIGLAHPRELAVARRAAGDKARDVAAPAIGERQLCGKCRKRGDLQPIEGDAAVRWRAVGCTGLQEREVEWR